MATSLNKVSLIGNVGKDPEVRIINSSSGKKVASFTLATTEVWYTKGGNNERNEKTEWHNIVIFVPPIVEVVEKYVRKGSKLYIEGSLHRRKWIDNSNTQANGQERHITEVILQSFSSTLIILDTRSGNGSSNAFNRDSGGIEGPGAFMSGSDGFSDEDIPF